jgi:hypothetical protein
LRSFLWLFAELESALDESAKALAEALAEALAGAAEQREADHAAMSEAVSDVYRVLGSGDVPSGSSPRSRLQVLGDHVRGRLREALHHGVRRAFAVLASHYVVDLERVSEGYCLPDEDETALAEVQRLDAAAAGPSAVLATTFEAEILPPAPSPEAGMDFADGGDEAEVVLLSFLRVRLRLFSNRVVFPSRGHFLRRVTSEVFLTRRRRSPSAQSALPLTCTRVRSLGPSDIAGGNAKSFF